MARIILWIVVVVGTMTAALAERAPPGGYSRVSVNDTEVFRAGAFAVEAEQKVMEEGKLPAKLELVAIAQAERQVVAGVKYRLRLTVRMKGVDKNAEAEVWWQPWRKAEPYRLTRWKWD